MSKETITPWANGGLPPDYRPFETLEICSNKLIRTKIPMDIGGIPLLLIGVGDRCPQAWLSAPTAPGSTERRYILEGYASFVQALRVTLNAGTGTTDVRLGDALLLSVKQSDAKSATVTSLNFVPIGLQIVGDSQGLSIGGGKLVRNTMVDVQVGIGLA